MPDFGIFRGFNDKLFGNKLYAGQLPTQLGLIGSESFGYLYLLDDYPNAAAAYSLRLLRSAYTGSAIKVRRASDNTEQNIGFVDNVLDTTTLASFCSGTNGFVTTWYDQSGNGNNATQIFSAYQPQIVSSGIVIIENSKPIVKAVNDTNFLTVSITSTNINSLFASISLDNSDDFFATTLSDEGGSYFLLGNNGSTSTVLQQNVGSPTNYKNSTTYTGVNRDNVYDDFQGQNLLSIIGATPTTWSKVNIGYRSSGPIKMANTQEIVVYSNNQSTNRTGIETNINNFYSIY